MQDLRDSLTRIALNPAYHDVLTVAKVSTEEIIVVKVGQLD